MAGAAQSVAADGLAWPRNKDVPWTDHRRPKWPTADNRWRRVIMLIALKAIPLCVKGRRCLLGTLVLSDSGLLLFGESLLWFSKATQKETDNVVSSQILRGNCLGE